MTKQASILLMATLILISGCGETSSSASSTSSSQNNTHERNPEEGHSTLLAYYGDKENNRIVVVDVDQMELIDEIATGHEQSYAAEIIKTQGEEHNSKPKLYVDNRGSRAIDVIDTERNTIVKTIDLDFYPRSINVNKERALVLVSGVNRAMSAVIDADTDEVVATVGSPEVTYPTSSGHAYISSGTLASGHPEWLNEDHFVMIDRQHRKIDTYQISQQADGTWQTTLVNSLATPSPVHNLIPPEIHGKGGHTRRGHGVQYATIFYATAEGVEDIYPSVLKLEFVSGEGLSIVDELPIQKEGLSPNIMGVHHLNFLNNQKYIYVGSDEGNLFVVNYENDPMVIEKIIPAGKGAGHTSEFKHGNIAVVINHKDRFITLINTDTNEKIADIEVSQIEENRVGSVQTQSHPAYHFSEDGRYFYLFLTQEGALVKVDLENKQVAERLEIGGKLAMGSFVGH